MNIYSCEYKGVEGTWRTPYTPIVKLPQNFTKNDSSLAEITSFDAQVFLKAVATVDHSILLYIYIKSPWCRKQLV